jgi:hypothetical protein
MNWMDTKEQRAPNSKAYVFINDNERVVPGNMIEALKNYEINTVHWSQKEKFSGELAA